MFGGHRNIVKNSIPPRLHLKKSKNVKIPRTSEDLKTGYPEQNKDLKTDYPEQNQDLKTGYPEQNVDLKTGYPGTKSESQKLLSR